MRLSLLAPVVSACVFLTGCASPTPVNRMDYNLQGITRDESLALIQKEVPNRPGALDTYVFDSNGFHWTGNLPGQAIAVVPTTTKVVGEEDGKLVSFTYTTPGVFIPADPKSFKEFVAFADVDRITRRDRGSFHQLEFHRKGSKPVRGVVLTGCTPEQLRRLTEAFLVLCPNAQ